jgi:transcriptional regulator with XRE-family HTH domain
MKRSELIQKLAKRKEAIGVSLENIARLSKLGTRTVNRVFSGEDVKLSTIEKITNILGVDFAGNETLTLHELHENRAQEKALYIASLTQDTSKLELQGLNKSNLNFLITQLKDQFLNGSYRKTLWVD